MEINKKEQQWQEDKKQPAELKEIKKILVVRFRQIGDSILSAVICNTLKKSFPNAQVDYVIYDFVAPLFENSKYIDNLVVLDKETRDNPFKYIKFVWKLMRKEKYDVVIDQMATPKSELFTFFAFGAPYRIGHKVVSKKYWNMKRRGFTYNYTTVEPENPKDNCWKYLKMLEPLENAGYKMNYTDDIGIIITDEEKNDLRARMELAGLDFTKEVVVFSVNSRRGEKVYPKKMMEELIFKFMKRYKDKQIVFFYSPDEKEYAMGVYKDLIELDSSLTQEDPMKGFSNKIFINIVTKNIRELAMLIKNCDLFIGNDGGPRHIAHGVDTKSFAIFSPASNKKDWMPMSNPRHIAVEARDFLEEIAVTLAQYNSMPYNEKYEVMSPARVMARIEEFLNEKPMEDNR